MKKINIKLTITELQAVAIATAEHWIKFKNEKRIETPQWKKLSEKLFAIYRINRKNGDIQH